MPMFGLARGLSLPSCRREWLARDVIAGVVLSTLLAPQGMAYAELAGPPPITGPYTSILRLAGYAAFGPSRVLALGPDSSLGPMIAATIVPLAGAGGDPERAVALASMLAIIVGAIMIAGAPRPPRSSSPPSPSPTSTPSPPTCWRNSTKP
jgi:MFS superfamily sulfate permease-like transporter